MSSVMKVRTSGPGDVHTLTVFQQKDGAGVWQTTNPDYQPGVIQKVSWKSTTGWDIPGYSKLKRAGTLLPHTPFTQFEYEAEGVGNYRLLWNPNGGQQVLPDGKYAGVTPKDTMLALLNTEAAKYDASWLIQQAANNIYTQNFDALTFIAELNSVRRMFVDVAHRFHRLLRRMLRYLKRKRRVPPDAQSAPAHEFANIWLQFRYGWRPLLKDMQAIALLSKNWDKPVTLRQSKTSQSDTNRTDFSSVAGGSPSAPVTTTTTVRWDIGLRGSVTADITPPKVQLNAAITAWEMIRFSFVIDWFISVGSSIGALNLVVFSTAYTASSGIKVKRSKLSVRQSGAPLAPFYYWDGSFVVTEDSELLLRTPGSIPLLPQPRVKLDVTKVIDLVALITQLIRR